MNWRLKLFRIVLILGILVNLGFIVPALAVPDTLQTWLHLHPNQAAFPWMGNAAVLLIEVSAFYLVIAVNPARYPAMAWVASLTRLGVSFFWLRTSRAPGQASLRPFFYTDLAFAVVQLALLAIGLPKESRISPRRVGRWVGAPFVGLARSRKAQVVTLLVLAILGTTGYWVWANIFRMQADATFADPADQFKYGAIGLSFGSRIPLALFEVLPEMFPDKLPGGWASLGLQFEPGHDTPVGFSVRNVGFPSLEPNCALCHTSDYKTTDTASPVLLLGAPAHTLDLQGLQHFLFSAAADPRFNTSNLLAHIEKHRTLNFGQKLAYRLLILPAAKQSLLSQARSYAWQDSRPTQGKGRTDTFNPTKINVFHLPDDGTIGTVDYPAIWNQRPKEGLYLHWDGNNNSLTERNYAAAMAVGATAHSVITPNFNKVTTFLLDLQPPAYPFPVDPALAAQGQAVWQANCASCHAFGSALVGQVTPIQEIATDAHRLDSFTQALLNGFHAINDPPLVFDAYRKTNGYANVPLDGIWARAPYLHNGSVPTLADLLTPPAQRPTVFYTGYDVYDPTNVGFVSTGPQAAASGFRFDTTVAGNSNAGHAYGTTLSDPDKKALIEYMKTL